VTETIGTFPRAVGATTRHASALNAILVGKKATVKGARLGVWVAAAAGAACSVLVVGFCCSERDERSKEDRELHDGDAQVDAKTRIHDQGGGDLNVMCAQAGVVVNLHRGCVSCDIPFV